MSGSFPIFDAVCEHLAAQPDRRHRHQQLLGPRVHHLDAEPAADVGGDDVDLAEVEA